jgi:sec-independent protein translocase protein TatA
MPFGIGPGELAIVLVLALIILGPKRLPEVGRSVGRGMREFKEGISGSTSPVEEDEDRDVAARRVEASSTTK